MARQLRISFEGAWYHVMNRGINRNNIFYNDSHRYAFLDLLGKTKDIYGIEIHSYCLMSNHYHLIIHTPRGNISQVMRYINGSYARIVNSSLNRDGPLFKGRFKAIIISADEYLIRLSRYIHLNPYKAEIVSCLSEYKWSSYCNYIGKTRYPNWLTTAEIIKRFGKKSFRQNYIKFVENNNDNELDNFYASSKYNPALGNVEFCKLIDEIKSHSLSAEIVGADRIRKPPTMEEIINYASQYFGVERNSIIKINRISGNIPRQIVIYVCRKLGGKSLKEIAGSIGNINYKGVSKAISRVSCDQSQLKIANKIINGMNGRG